MTDYGFLVRACELPADINSHCADDRGRIIAEKLAELAEPLGNAMDSFDRGGWEVVSHDVLQTGNSLVVTFLVRRL